MFADTFLAYERAHLIRLMMWGGASVVVGTALLTLLAVRRANSPLLKHFAIQTALWGAIDLALAGASWRGLELRDLAGATAVDRFLWLNAGLDVGYIAVGATIALSAWLLGKRLGGVGAGLGVLVQGAALLALDLRILMQIGTLI